MAEKITTVLSLLTVLTFAVPMPFGIINPANIAGVIIFGGIAAALIRPVLKLDLTYTVTDAAA